MSHAMPNVLLHYIFSTKDRRPLIEDSFRQQLYQYMGGIARNEFGKAILIGGTSNHIHALLSIGTDMSLGEVMSKFKSLSSGWVHRTFPKARSFAWQKGYSVFSVSESVVPQVQAYIARQEEHHKTVSFEEEYMEFLRRHHIEFDPDELWD
jgi:putative transposase